MKESETNIHYLEMVTPDAKALSELYHQLHGWVFQPLVPELGNAYVASLPGGMLFGIRAPMSAEEKPISRTYVRIPDIADAVQNAKRNGANILLENMEIPGRGNIAIFSLGGLEHGVWQIP